MPSAYSVQAKFLAEHLPVYIAEGKGAAVCATSRLILNRGPDSRMTLETTFDTIRRYAIENRYIYTGDVGNNLARSSYGGLLFARLIRKKTACALSKSPGVTFIGVELVRAFRYAEREESGTYNIHFTAAKFFVEEEQLEPSTFLNDLQTKARLLRGDPIRLEQGETIQGRNEALVNFTL